MSKFIVRFVAVGAPTVEILTENPDRVIKRSFNHDIKHGTFPRWIPFQGKENIRVEVVESKFFKLEDGKYVKASEQFYML